MGSSDIKIKVDTLKEVKIKVGIYSFKFCLFVLQKELLWVSRLSGNADGSSISVQVGLSLSTYLASARRWIQ